MGNLRNFLLCLPLLVSIQLTNGVDNSGRKPHDTVASEHVDTVVSERLGEHGNRNSENSRAEDAKIFFPSDLENIVKKPLASVAFAPNQFDFQDVGQGYRNDSEIVGEERASHENGGFNFDRFPRYNEIVGFMRELVNGSKYAKMISIGTSYEGRQILGIQLETSKDNPRIFVDAGIHAREWAAPLVAMYIMKRIIEFEETLAKKISIYVIPVANPDGYEYTHTDDRFWRKSRSKSNHSSCIGVDLNRNFDSYWSVYGVQSSPCAGVFPGYGPFSEPEAVAIREAILTLRPHMYLTFHSYGPMLLYPWGFTHELPRNWKELDDLARAAIAELKKVNGQDYVIGSSTNVLYLASGGSDDWAMEKGHVPLVYTMELPGYGSGFVVPVEKIVPMVTETFAAFKVFMKYVCSLYHSDCGF